MRRALLAGAAAFGFLAVLALGSPAQEAKKDKPEDKADARRASIEVSGYTRPGNPDDLFDKDGHLIRQVGYEAESMKKFKIMGGTVYFAVFRNTGLVEGDTFGTGLANFDAKFEAGRSFRDSMSPRYDRKAKYLYLYQIVNDRNLDPRLAEVKGAAGGGGIKNPFLIPGKEDKAAPPVTDDIAVFALKLITDPRYITSWGHFRDSSFAATVVDVDASGKLVKNVADDGKGNKVEANKIIHTSFSYLPNIVTKIANPAYGRRARSHTLGELENGFGVEVGSLNLKESKAYGDIKLVADQGGKGDIRWVGFAESILKATDTVKEPDYVQLMYLSAEERAALTLPPLIPGSGTDTLDDEITRAIFRVDWRNANLLKQGSRSVVFGFTTDLPPTSAPIRIDTPRASAVAENLRLANYFADEGMGRAPGGAPGTGIALTAGGVDAAAGMALALGTAVGVGATPAPGADASAAGFAGMTGGFSSLGGTTTGGGGGGGLGFPGWGAGGGISRGGGFGGGGGFGNGQGENTPAQIQDQTGRQAQAGNQTINFTATLTNTQNQNQQQSQFQNQNQNRNQGGKRGHGHRGGHGDCSPGNGGHVVPAPASLLLGLLGLPGLYFLRRRKDADAAA